MLRLSPSEMLVGVGFVYICYRGDCACIKVFVLSSDMGISLYYNININFDRRDKCWDLRGT